jgi:hypothetical protein
MFEIEGHGPPWIGSGGARRGLLAKQAPLASFPFHFPGLLTHRWRCSEPSWVIFLEKFAWKFVCGGAKLLRFEGFIYHEDAKDTKDFCIVFGEPCAGVHGFWL